MTSPAFVPALGADWLTPFYDAVAWLIGERALKRRLLEAAKLTPGADVLDLGCGTGTLAIMAKALCPGAHVVGLDLDPRILAIARRKLDRLGVDVKLQAGSATAPPFPPASFDRIVTTLMLHHLTTAEKQQALAAARRLLRPGGELHIADWGRPQNGAMRLVSSVVAWFDGPDRLAANLNGELVSMLVAAGFTRVTEGARRMTPFGTLAFLHAAV
jgi:ubiquinone/menaquinone biosynthesis C-methylase UbiE